MRLFYFNNERHHHPNLHPHHHSSNDDDKNQIEEETEKVISLLTQRDVTYEQLRLANEEAYNRINELQSELLIYKSKQESNNNSYETLLLKNQRLGSLQLEENLKRERQAAQAIAKHDATIISNYEKEIERLQDTHHADTLLISECSERVSELMKIIEDKNKELERQQQSLFAAQQHVEVLTDRISKQEILLIKNEQSLKSNAIASMSRALGHQHNQHYPPPPPPHPSSTIAGSHYHPPFSSSFASGAYHTERSAPPPPAYPAHNHQEGRDREPNLSTFQPAPKLGVPFFAESIDSPPSQTSPSRHLTASRSTDPQQQQHHSYSHPQHHNLPPVSSHHLHQSFPLRKDQIPKESPGTRGNPFPSAFNTSPSHQQRQTSPSSIPPSHPSRTNDDLSTPQDEDPIFATNKLRSVLYRELESCKLQIKSLTEENGILKDTLEKNKQLIENQEKTLERVRTSAEEITLLEAEEIARLEVEIEHLKVEKDKWMSLCHRHETQLELLKQELYARENSGQETSQKASAGNGNGSPMFKYRLSSSFTPSSSSAHRPGSTFATSQSVKTGSAFSRSWNSFPTKSADHHGSLSQPDSPVIEMYR